MAMDDGVVAKLRRWEDSGAVWRVVGRTDSELVVSLLTCTAGEEVDRIVSADPGLRAYIGGRTSSDDYPGG